METDTAITANQSEKVPLKPLGQYMFLESNVHDCRSPATPGERNTRSETRNQDRGWGVSQTDHSVVPSHGTILFTLSGSPLSQAWKDLSNKQLWGPQGIMTMTSTGSYRTVGGIIMIITASVWRAVVWRLRRQKMPSSNSLSNNHWKPHPILTSTTSF